MTQLTSRDEAMLDWMNVVRLADVDAIRWALSAHQDGHDGPVSVRRANYWIARMAELGYLGRVRPMYRDRQIVWPTYRSSGRSAPSLFRQTMRHELAVASVSGRFVAAGYQWQRDRQPVSRRDHQADGVATLAGRRELIEVELTVKKVARYELIFANHSDRVREHEVTKVLYFSTPEVNAIVLREAKRLIFRTQLDQFLFTPCMDAQGRFVSVSSEVDGLADR